MSAPGLRILFNLVYWLALSTWIGAGAFHVLVVTPSLAKTLPLIEAARAGRVLRQRLNAWGSTCFAIALPSFLGVPLSFPEDRGPWIAVQSVVIVGCILALIANSQTPTKPQPFAGSEAGSGGHRVVGATMLAALILLVANLIRPAPRSLGIVEPTPQERARRAAESRSVAGSRDALESGVSPGDPP